MEEENSPITCIGTESGDGSKEFIKSVKVNGIECAGWWDMTSQVTLDKESFVREEDRQRGKSLNILALAEFSVTGPLAKVHLEGEGFKGDDVVGIRNLLPADILIGNNIVSR